LATIDDTGLVGTDNITSQKTGLSFSATGVAGSYVTLFDDKDNDGVLDAGEALITDQLITTNAFAADVSLDAGVHNMRVFQTDAAGNVGAVSAALTVTVLDEMPAKPATPVLAAADDTGPLNNDAYTKNTTGLTFAGTAPSGVAQVRVFSDANNNGVFDTGETSSLVSVTAATGAYTADLALAANASYNIRQQFISTGGVVGEASDARVVTVDTIAPSMPDVPSLAPASDTGSSSTDNITSNALPLVRVSLASGQVGVGGKAQILIQTTLVVEQVVTAEDVANGYIDVQLLTPLKANAQTAFVCKLVDAAGNVSALPSNTLFITHDSIAPVAPANIDLANVDDLGVSDSDNVTSKMSGLSISMDVVSGTSLTLFDDKNDNNLLDEGEALVKDQLTTGSVYSTELVMGEGVHKLMAYQVDLAGNVSVMSAPMALTIVASKVVPNPITLVMDAEDDTGASSTDGITTKSSGLTFTGVADASAGVAKVRVFDDLNMNGLFDANEVGAIFAVKADGTFGVDFTLTPNMTHYMRVIQITDAGILSAAGPVKTVTIDTYATAPSIDTLITPSFKPILSGSALLTAGETMTVSVHGATYNVTPDAVSGRWSLNLGTATPASGTLGVFTERTYEVVATVIDALGNVATDATLGELNIDATAPSMPVIISQVMTANSLVVSGTAVLDLSEKLWLYVEGAKYALTPNASGAWSIDLATATPVSGTKVSIANGPFTVRVDAVDAAGNISRAVQGSNNDLITAEAADLLNLEAGQALVDGGKGYDTYRLLGANMTLDLTRVADTDFKSMERIDITGSGDNVLTLASGDVPSTLVVDGNAGDAMTYRGTANLVTTAGEVVFVDVNGNGTNDGATESFTTDAQGRISASLGNGQQTYALYKVGANKLLVDTDVTSFVSTPVITSMGKDSSTVARTAASTNDFSTTIGDAGHLFAGTLATPLPGAHILQISVNGGDWIDVPAENVTGTTWAYTDTSARFLPSNANNSVAVRLMDSNTGLTSRVETQVITAVTETVTAPVITAFTSDDGTSSTDGITGARSLSSVSGTAAANSRVTVYMDETAVVLGSTMTDAQGSWTLSGLNTSLLTGSLRHKLYATAALGDATSDWSEAKDVITTGLVQNGNFSAGTVGAVKFDATTSTLYQTGTAVTSFDGYPTSWSGATDGDKRAVYSNGIGTMWSQTVQVQTNTDYTLSYYTGNGGASLVYSSIETLDGTVLDMKAALSGVNVMSLNTVTWNSGSNTSVKLKLNLDYGQAVLDGIKFYASDVATGDLISGTPDNSVKTAADTLQVVDNGVGLSVLPMLGGLGDDVVEIGATQMGYLSRTGAFIDGGSGLDTLKLTGAAQVLDFSALTGVNSKATLQSVEVIDITGTGNNTLKLSLNDVLHMGSVNAFAGVQGAVNSVQMKIDGNVGDTLELKDLVAANDPGAWVQAANYTATNGNTYKVLNYAPLNAQLLVDADIQHTLVMTGSL
jgi:hypothetical protein